MTQITAKELKTHDPKRFEKEYYKWLAYESNDDWADYTYERFIEKCVPLGVRVDECSCSGFYSQGDGAAFTGKVDLGVYMRLHKLDEKYLALYLAVLDDASRFDITVSHHGTMGLSSYNMCANQTLPSGVFSDLDQEAWDELIMEQEKYADLETDVLKYINDLADELYTDLEAEYEHMTSEESFIDSCDCNEITFDIEDEDHEIYN